MTVTTTTRERLLSLDERDVAWRLDLAAAVHEMVSALIAHRTAHQQALYERMTHPRPGDYVYEVSFIYGRPDHRERYTGYLLRVADEPYEDHDDEPPPTRDVWYVQYGPADDDVVRWENCTFRVIPIGSDTFRRDVDELVHTILGSAWPR